LARSSSNQLDRLALVGIALGLALYVMPSWNDGRLKWAFWLTLLATLLHTFTSRRAAAGETEGGSS
jgi:hypothetical protein